MRMEAGNNANKLIAEYVAFKLTLRDMILLNHMKKILTYMLVFFMLISMVMSLTLGF